MLLIGYGRILTNLCNNLLARNTMNIRTFISTRDSNPALAKSFKDAILNPSAPQGGLYTFDTLPKLSTQDIISLSNLSYEGLCIKLFKILNLGLDEALLKDVLRCYKSFDNPNNPAPLHKFSDNLFMLNLYSGPTRAFKDMALQPFGALLSHFAAQKKQTYLILAATSGDTGPATLESFANKPYIKVICLYPDGGTSDIQRLQMTTQNASNCKVIGIKGNFDDAQSALKNLLNDKDFITNLHAQGIYLSAANSVNIGRIVFQIIYHFWAYFSLLKNAQITFGEKISIVVPSGNFGNILGAFFAKKMGLPLQKLVVASNVNNILSDFIHSGVYDVSSRVLLRSKSPAMDILKSSNVERVLYALFGAKRTRQLMESLQTKGAYSLNQDELALLQDDFSALYCDDTQCLQSMTEVIKKGFVLDPHSAIAYYGAKKLQKENIIDKSVFLATAEWSKFAPSVWEALQEAYSLQDGYSDEKNAIKDICEHTSAVLPQAISTLFNKPITQKDVVAISVIRSCIMQWIEQS